MKEHFSERLEELRRRLIRQAADVEKQIASAVEALEHSSEPMARDVIAADEAVDRAEIDIEEEAVRLLALEQPVATDLRFLVGVLKINSDLERIGDHAVNIAEGAARNAVRAPIRPLVDIAGMAAIAQAMLKDSIDAFVQRDSEKAKTVIRRDDSLDEKNESMIRELLTFMAETPSLISYCLELISVSKNLERVGDLATNIAEDTIYIAQALVVKHHAAEIR